MARTGGRGTVSKVLRRAIRDSGKTLYRIAKDAGIDYMSLHRFAHGKTMLSLDAVDRVCAYLGLELMRRE
jgi:hypothetical protein